MGSVRHSQCKRKYPCLYVWYNKKSWYIPYRSTVIRNRWQCSYKMPTFLIDVPFFFDKPSLPWSRTRGPGRAGSSCGGKDQNMESTRMMRRSSVASLRQVPVTNVGAENRIRMFHDFGAFAFKRLLRIKTEAHRATPCCGRYLSSA